MTEEHPQRHYHIGPLDDKDDEELERIRSKLQQKKERIEHDLSKVKEEIEERE